MTGLRIWRSPFSDFYRDETLHAAEVYTEDTLRKIADAGFNAIWIHAHLHEVVRTRAFPDLGHRSAAHLRSLRAVMERGSRVGCRLVLFMQPPAGLPVEHPFWKRHPDARGVVYRFEGRDIAALCTSTASVRDHLQEGALRLSQALPDLAAVILITASEHVSHCYSHYNNFYAPPEMAIMPPKPLGCPRCESRGPAAVVGDVVRAIHSGLREAGHGARTVAWNWSWTIYESDPPKGILRALPRGVTVMSDFERGGTRVIRGKRRVIDEYSLSYPGPSPRFVKTCRAAQERRLPVMAKLQIGVTHEVATVPNLPLIGNLYDKARAMRRLGVKDFMGCWNFGSMLTANTAALLRFLDADPLPPRKRALREFAAEYFPGCAAERVAAAWERFADAMEYYPFSIPFLYYGPINMAVQLPIAPGPLRNGVVGRSWMADRRGDDLCESLAPPALHPFSAEEVVASLADLLKHWQEGTALLERGLTSCAHPHAREELATVRMIAHCAESARNLYRAYLLRRAWRPANLKALKAIARDERRHLDEALAIARSDRRMGFHSECQARLFTPDGIRRKIRALDRLLRD